MCSDRARDRGGDPARPGCAPHPGASPGERQVARLRARRVCQAPHNGPAVGGSARSPGTRAAGSLVGSGGPARSTPRPRGALPDTNHPRWQQDRGAPARPTSHAAPQTPKACVTRSVIGEVSSKVASRVARGESRVGHPTRGRGLTTARSRRVIRSTDRHRSDDRNGGCERWPTRSRAGCSRSAPATSCARAGSAKTPTTRPATRRSPGASRRARSRASTSMA